LKKKFPELPNQDPPTSTTLHSLELDLVDMATTITDFVSPGTTGVENESFLTLKENKFLLAKATTLAQVFADGEREIAIKEAERAAISISVCDSFWRYFVALAKTLDVLHMILSEFKMGFFADRDSVSHSWLILQAQTLSRKLRFSS
jgi:hypothetical protein